MPSPAIRLVNSSSFESTQNDSTWVVNAQRDSLAANCYVILAQANAGRSFTAADNKTNANWRTAGTLSSGQSAHILTCTNVAAGTNQVTLTEDLSDTFNSFCLLEIAGVSTASGASSQRGSAATRNGVSTASTTLNTTAALTNSVGDILIMAVFDVNQNGGCTFTPGSGWTLLATNIIHGMAIAWKVATSINETPTMTRSAGTQTYNVIAIALIPDNTKGDATQNVAGSNVFPWAIMHQYNAPGAGPGINFQFPCKGNCVTAVIWNGTGTPSPISVSSITDSTSANTWAIPGSGGTQAKVSVTNGTIELWTPGATTTSATMTGTITFSAAIALNAGGLTVFTDWLGANSSPVGASNHASGTSSTNVTTLATVSITPTAQFSTSITGAIINSHCVSGYTGTGMHFPIFTDPAADGGEHSLEDDDGVGMYENGSSTASTAMTITIQNNAAGGIGTWGAVAVEIKVAPAAGGALKKYGNLDGLSASGGFFAGIE